jgi:pimeloyl-ACP methyl ester carboxylesterase
VLIHGLGRTRRSMSWLARALRAEGYRVLNFGYHSRRESIASHAERLAAFLAASLSEDSREVHFVTHSLGSIVVRHLLTLEDPGARVRRVVMLGPPNQGSSFARKLRPISFVPKIMGPSFLELCELELPAPPEHVEIGIISGGTGGARGVSPLVSGDNDGIVAVREAALEGSRDHITVRGLHSFLMYQPLVVREVLRFLKEGRFSESHARPSPKDNRDQ